jgi:outer membrane protein
MRSAIVAFTFTLVLTFAFVAGSGPGLAAQGTPTGQPQPAGAARPLTLHDAEQRALNQHPVIKAEQYSAQAAEQTVREARSAFFPTAFGAVTAAGASSDGSRLAAGALNNPSVYDRFATGIGVSQLVTDFGRTKDLVQSSTLNAQSTEKTVDARRADILLQVDRAYYDALRAKAVLQVAQETVSTRQTVADQVQALANANLKSGLDVSFAQVNLSDAQLLLVQAQNDLQSAYVSLAEALGDRTAAVTYDLVDEPQPPAPTNDSSALIAQALRDRPDVAAQRLADQAATEFARAEHSLWMPTVSLLGAAGVSPYHGTGILDHYSAGGVNVTIPVANGGLFNARHAQALYKAQAEDELTRDLENRVSRDVTVAWLTARTSYQRLDLTNQLLAHASDALDLAQSRYNLGLSSIVELTQAQLNKTAAEIAQSTARYEYQASVSALRYQTGELK